MTPLKLWWWQRFVYLFISSVYSARPNPGTTSLNFSHRLLSSWSGLIDPEAGSVPDTVGGLTYVFNRSGSRDITNLTSVGLRSSLIESILRVTFVINNILSLACNK